MNLIPEEMYEKLSQKDREDLDSLLRVCCKEHKGAGGACICICGAGAGGSKACSGLRVVARLLHYGE